MPGSSSSSGRPEVGSGQVSLTFLGRQALNPAPADWSLSSELPGDAAGRLPPLELPPWVETLRPATGRSTGGPADDLAGVLGSSLVTC
jgi:hypothetical protein